MGYEKGLNENLSVAPEAELEPVEMTVRDVAMERVREWRAYAGVLEELPGLIQFAADPETFEKMLYNAEGVLDGTAAKLGENTSWIDVYR
jgi:hypothetical protein